MRRRDALKMMAAIAVGSGLPFARESWEASEIQDPSGWAARIASLPQSGDSDVLLTATGDLIINTPATARSGANIQQMYRVIREADVSFGNCEEAIAASGFLQPKTAVMGWPSILDDLKSAGFDMLSVANNHFMDLGEGGALEGLSELAKREFVVAGSGRNLAEAVTPGIIRAKGQRLGMLSFWCNSIAGNSDWYVDLARAGTSKPGIAIISGFSIRTQASAQPVPLPLDSDLRTMTDAVSRAKSQVDFLMISFHMHWAGPADAGGVSEGRRIICRAAVDAGADLVIGHGPHVLNGIEIHRGKPILYSLGHFYFQMMDNGKAKSMFSQSPSTFRTIETGFNTPDHRRSAIARMMVRSGRVARLDLIPLTVDVPNGGNPALASETETAAIIASLQEMSKGYGTEMRSQGWYTEVVLPS